MSRLESFSQTRAGEVNDGVTASESGFGDSIVPSNLIVGSSFQLLPEDIAEAAEDRSNSQEATETKGTEQAQNPERERKIKVICDFAVSIDPETYKSEELQKILKEAHYLSDDFKKLYKIATEERITNIRQELVRRNRFIECLKTILDKYDLEHPPVFTPSEYGIRDRKHLP